MSRAMRCSRRSTIGRPIEVTPLRLDVRRLKRAADKLSRTHAIGHVARPVRREKDNARPLLEGPVVNSLFWPKNHSTRVGGHYDTGRIPASLFTITLPVSICRLTQYTVNYLRRTKLNLKGSPMQELHLDTLEHTCANTVIPRQPSKMFITA